MLLKKIAVSFLVTSLFALSARAITAAAYEKKPKLVVVLVIDQFRADLLSNKTDDFLPPGTPAAPGGFRYLTHQGAWFPFAQYDILQAMTCTGHAMILTGSHPASTGIGTNEWFNPKTRKMTYCAEDADFGLSPRRLRTTTVGDELKNVREKSRVVAVAAKDRSAIMLGGHRADIALWMHEKESRWVTSSYYNKGELPAWLKPINDRLAKETAKDDGRNVTVKDAIEITGWTLDLAIEALKKEKLGRGADPDILAVSLSYHDIIGHMYGPNSKEIREITLAEDRLLSGFLKNLRKEMGSLDDVVIAFTADHGTPPASDVAKQFKLDTGRFEMLPVIRKINQRLDQKFGASGKEWLLGFRLFHFFLNPEVIAEKKADEDKVAAEVKAVLLEEPGVLDVFTKGDFEKGRFPVGTVGEQLKHSYIPGQSGDIVMIAKPFFYEKGSNPVTHMTGWSYDRSVPLLLVGRAFKPGVYPGGLVIDLAPTLSFVLGVLPPAKNEGRVLGEALR